MTAPLTVLLLVTGQTLHGALVVRGPFRYRLVLEDGSVATVRRRAVLALATEPTPKGEPDVR